MHTVTQPSPRRSLTSLYPRRRLIAAQHERRLDHACHPTFLFARHGVALQLFTCRRRSIGLDPRSDGYLASLEPRIRAIQVKFLAISPWEIFSRAARVCNCLIFQGNFRKRKTQTTALFPEEFPETLVKGKLSPPPSPPALLVAAAAPAHRAALICPALLP